MGNHQANYVTQTGIKIFAVAGSYIVFGAVIYHWLEGFSWLDSFYFVIITLATIGYGDIFPKTNAGKLFTIFFVIVGLGLFSALITNLAKRARERRERRISRK
jgi:voltage-gated potassium channel Kch